MGGEGVARILGLACVKQEGTGAGSEQKVRAGEVRQVLNGRF